MVKGSREEKPQDWVARKWKQPLRAQRGTKVDTGKGKDSVKEQNTQQMINDYQFRSRIESLELLTEGSPRDSDFTSLECGLSRRIIWTLAGWFKCIGEYKCDILGVTLIYKAHVLSPWSSGVYL